MTSPPWTPATLAAHLGVRLLDAPPVSLGHAGPLLATDDPAVLGALPQCVPADGAPDARAQAAAAAAAALRTWLGVGGRIVLGASAGGLLERAVAEARARTGRAAVVALDPFVTRPRDALPLARSEAMARLGRGDVAALVFEPRVEDEAQVAELRALTEAARQHGVQIVADETRTAGRVHAGASALALSMAWDVLVLGPALACGQDFAALVEAGGEPGETTVELADPPPGVLATVLACATATVLARQPVHDRLLAHGEQLARTFAEAAAREQIDCGLVGPAALARVHIATQEGVAAPLLRWHFAAEMERAGVGGGEWVVAHALWPELEPRLAAAVRATLGRLRTLLVESNSYLSGGLPYVFATDSAVLRERGLARYRYPKRGEVDVTTEGDRVRIRFAAGSLGPITSSGFFVPTHIRGDFTVEAEYELRQWSHGPDSACFGLFFQNELSTGRYYAQRTAARGAPEAVHGSFDGVLTPGRSVRGSRGAFRLARRGAVVTAWHREDGGDWQELGRTEHATTDDGILGAKIWSKLACEGLEAEVVGLRIEADPVPDQAPPVAARPDPRGR